MHLVEVVTIFEVDTLAFEQDTCWRRFLDCVMDVFLQPTAEDYIKRKFTRQYLPKLTHGQRVTFFWKDNIRIVLCTIKHFLKYLCHFFREVLDLVFWF